MPFRTNTPCLSKSVVVHDVVCTFVIEHPILRCGEFSCGVKASLWSSVVVVTKIAAKVVAKKAAKQAAAEQAEVKAKKAIADADKATEEEATKELAEQMMPAEEATPAKATKE